MQPDPHDKSENAVIVSRLSRVASPFDNNYLRKAAMTAFVSDAIRSKNALTVDQFIGSKTEGDTGSSKSLTL